MSESNSVYLVDDDRALLDSLQHVFTEHDYSVHCYTDSREFINEGNVQQPGCLISDARELPVSGRELLSRLRDLKSPISVILATDAADAPLAVSLMELGAFTLVNKPYNENKLLDAVHLALATSEQRWHKVQREKSLAERLQSLSEEEKTVMKLMLTGAPIKSISWQLHLSERTVDRRRQSILQKMQVKSLLELALLLARID